MIPQNSDGKVRPDGWLIVTSVLFLCVSLLMVTTSSMYTAQQYDVNMFHYGIRQAIFVVIGGFIAFLTFHISLQKWYRVTPILIAITFSMLIAVLIPGIGREVNGSMRWIPLGLFNLQPSELAKLLSLIYIAGYLHRHHDQLKSSTIVMIVPLFVLGAIGVFILLEPDFGSTMIIFIVGLGVMFIAGVSLWRFLFMLSVTLVLMAFILWTSPYRRARLISFMDPWQDMYNSGYQLTNSLIAIGRGRLGGVGIGESVQKMGYLPEAHTDFIFSIYAEEFGAFGALALILFFLIFVRRAFVIGGRADALKMRFAAYISYGIGIWVAAQAAIHMSVTMGLLPTKGLTLPFISYGGSSVITMIVTLSLLFRVDIDSQHEYIRQRDDYFKAKSLLNEEKEQRESVEEMPKEMATHG